MSQLTLKAVRPALRKQSRAMIGNLFFGPVEAVPIKSTKTTVSFRRCDNGEQITFPRDAVGDSVFIQYFTP
jgi:hypothetical protein